MTKENRFAAHISRSSQPLRKERHTGPECLQVECFTAKLISNSINQNYHNRSEIYIYNEFLVTLTVYAKMRPNKSK